MDVWAWLALSVCPLTIVGLGIACARMLTMEPPPYKIDPGVAHKDQLRKGFKELTYVLTDEDKDWVTEQMKLTGFDPTMRRYNVDRHPEPWSRDML